MFMSFTRLQLNVVILLFRLGASGVVKVRSKKFAIKMIVQE